MSDILSNQATFANVDAIKRQYAAPQRPMGASALPAAPTAQQQGYQQRINAAGNDPRLAGSAGVQDIRNLNAQNREGAAKAQAAGKQFTPEEAQWKNWYDQSFRFKGQRQQNPAFAGQTPTFTDQPVVASRAGANTNIGAGIMGTSGVQTRFDKQGQTIAGNRIFASDPVMA